MQSSPFRCAPIHIWRTGSHTPTHVGRASEPEVHCGATHTIAVGFRVTRDTERSDGLTRVRRSRDDESVHVIEDELLTHRYLKWLSHSERSDT